MRLRDIILSDKTKLQKTASGITVFIKPNKKQVKNCLIRKYTCGKTSVLEKAGVQQTQLRIMEVSCG